MIELVVSGRSNPDQLEIEVSPRTERVLEGLTKSLAEFLAGQRDLMVVGVVEDADLKKLAALGRTECAPCLFQVVASLPGSAASLKSMVLPDASSSVLVAQSVPATPGSPPWRVATSA